MKNRYFELKKDLPTFKAGDLFILNDTGLWHSTGGRHVDVMAYAKKTLELFPNILKDWFEPAPEPWRDHNTKERFISYLYNHKDERFFQAVRNFTNQYLDGKVDRVCCHRSHRKAEWCDDTFYWECDEMLEEDDDTQS